MAYALTIFLLYGFRHQRRGFQGIFDLKLLENVSTFRIQDSYFQIFAFGFFTYRHCKKAILGLNLKKEQGKETACYCS
jgi:hypothetical protein